jgi:alpha-beta hydrolase superfamily lysophospholipase
VQDAYAKPVNKGRKLIITGHSLGAAVATLFAVAFRCPYL